MDPATAINVGIGLTQLAMRVMEAATQVNQIVSRAQTEGRDLTDDEKAAIRGLRDNATARWKDLAPDEGK